MLGELTSSTDPNISEIANVARTLAPSDPRTNWLFATAEISVFTPEAVDASVGLFEETVRSSPFDFRWWIEYGRALEQAGREDDAERALRRSIELSPNYAYPHWQLGNFYLRQGRGDEAIVELRLATTNNRTYRNQVFALAWDYFGHQTAMVERLVADTPDVRSDLASFYARRNQPADALRIWNTLSDSEKARYPQTVRSIAEALFELRAYRESEEFSRQAGIDPDAAPEVISNSGFEFSLKSADDTLFGWKVRRADSRLDITVDPSVHHSGAKSLRITFRSFAKPELYDVWQNVALAAATHYKLSFWVRTENLKSGGPPMLEVVDAADNRLLATSQSFPLGTNDWQQITMNFITPEGSNGVFVRTSRGFCGNTCPVVGIVWLDDFELARN
jgi:tetratricopeptide (TPR) repeat protein